MQHAMLPVPVLVPSEFPGERCLPEVPVSKTELVPSLDLTPLLVPEVREQRIARMHEIEDQIFQAAMGNVAAIQDATSISPEEENPPEDWIERYGQDAAEKRLVAAKQGWRANKDAPLWAVQALSLVVGIAKARGQSVRVGTLELNARISLPAPTTAEHPGPVVYEVRDLDE